MSDAKTRRLNSSNIVGWREWITFPNFDGCQIKAKIDTGAKTSALHAAQIEECERNGVACVRFVLHPVQRRKTPEIICIAPVADRRIVRSSNGSEESRFVIRTPICLGAKSWPIDLSLTNRDAMGFRLLIGREAMRRRFLVDPGGSYLMSWEE